MDGGKYRLVMGEGGGVEGDRGGGVCCFWRYLKGAVVRLISCSAPLKASRLLWINTLDESLFTGLLLGERSCICSSCGRWIFVCICVGGWILFGCVNLVVDCSLMYKGVPGCRLVDVCVFVL